MKRTDNIVNLPVNPQHGVALLSNVAACAELIEHLMNRTTNLPGMGVFYGPSGLGKSIAAAYCANKYSGYYVECRSYFTRKSFLLAVCKEMRLRPGRTVFEMVTQIGEQLGLCQRPLIIDEMDHLVERNVVELVRDLYEASSAAILMIGEEMFPTKLKQWERFHNRVLAWSPAEAADMDDAAKLARLYAPDVAIGADLLAEIVKQSRGVHRRICVNIDLVRTWWKPIGGGKSGPTLKEWGDRAFYTGDAPVRRMA